MIGFIDPGLIRGMTQWETFTKPRSYVSNYETGERRHNVVERLSVAQLIGFDAKKMIGKVEG